MLESQTNDQPIYVGDKKETEFDLSFHSVRQSLKTLVIMVFRPGTNPLSETFREQRTLKREREREEGGGGGGNYLVLPDTQKRMLST